jgi:hypothetical protein
MLHLRCQEIDFPALFGLSKPAMLHAFRQEQNNSKNAFFGVSTAEVYVMKMFNVIGLRLAVSDCIFGRRLNKGLSGVECVSAENFELYRGSRSRLQGSV